MPTEHTAPPGVAPLHPGDMASCLLRDVDGGLAVEFAVPAGGMGGDGLAVNDYGDGGAAGLTSPKSIESVGAGDQKG